MALLARYSPVLLCAAVLVWHALQYGFVTDDAYISFVYARNFAEHGELSFNLGDPVEGYTNFLWTVILGLFMVIGLAPELMSLVLGIGFACATLLVVHRMVTFVVSDAGSDSASNNDSASAGSNVATGARAGPEVWPWSTVAPALLAFSAGYACWASGGLETQMFTFFVTLALYWYARGDHDGRALRRVGVVCALAAMTRPEGLLLTGLIGAHRLVYNLLRERRLVPSRDELVCLACFLAVWAPWYGWRWWYYGYPFPNTYYVKAAGEPPPGYADKLMNNGLYYVWQWARQTRAVYAAPLIIVGLVGARPGSRRLYLGSLALAFGLVYLAYTVRVGGDFMGLHRFIMPVFVISALGAALGLRLLANWLANWLANRLANRLANGLTMALANGLALVLAVGLVATFAHDQLGLTRRSMAWANWRSDHGIDTPSYLRIYTLDRAAIGAHMRDCFRADDFSIVGGAGAQPYKGRMRAIDVFGLVSERIAHEVEPSNPRAGHNKWAPNQLLLDYQPTFVFSCYAIHSAPDNPRFNCQERFWLNAGYQRVTLHIPTLRQQGQYYSFFKRADRDFQCPGMVR